MSPPAARRTDHAGVGTPQSAAGYAPSAPRHAEDKGLPSGPDPGWAGPACRKAPESFDAGLLVPPASVATRPAHLPDARRCAGHFRRSCRSVHGPPSTPPGIRALGTGEGLPEHCLQERCGPAKWPHLVPRHQGTVDQGTVELLDVSAAGKAESRMFGSSRSLRITSLAYQIVAKRLHKFNALSAPYALPDSQAAFLNRSP